MADSPLQNASGTGIAQAYGEGAIAHVTVGFTSEQVESIVKASGFAQQAKIDELAQQLNVTREAVRGFLKILVQQDVPQEQLKAKLEEIAQRHNELLVRLKALDPEDDVARDLIDQAREVIRSAACSEDYDRADDLLSQAEEALSKAIPGAEALEREAHEAVRRMRLSKANTRAERAELCLTRLDYIQAAKHFKAAADSVGLDDPSIKFKLDLQSVDALHSYGDEKGVNTVLTEAIGEYRKLMCQYDRNIVPLDWARIQNNLGNALRTLGDREADRTRLVEAVAAYRAALQERTRERMPLEWAGTLSNLSNALTSLGKRETGVSNLEEVIAGYRAALEVCTRERVPLQWAMTQINLGVALRALGDRQKGKSRLEEAVVAYRAALEECTREREPLLWAKTQDNMATALTALGNRESGTDRFMEALVAYRAALEVITRERMPLQWAMTQNNLGGALGELGKREGGTARGCYGLCTSLESLLGVVLTSAWRDGEVSQGVPVGCDG